jgi:hypothetical protein
VLVGSLGNGVVNSTPGGRFMSLLDSSSTNTDGAATTRAILIGWAGGTTPSSSWQVYRNNAQLCRRRDCVRHGRADRHDLLRDQRLLRRNNGSPIQAASSAAFNGTRIALGFREQQHVPLAARVLRRRVVVFLHRPQRSGSRELYADEKAFFGLP